MSKEAQCPECEEWSPVAYIYLDALDPIGGFWWSESNGYGCPKCHALICVESECMFRDVLTDAERDALEARMA